MVPIHHRPYEEVCFSLCGPYHQHYHLDCDSKNDSVYKDPKINELTSKQRKTIVDHWGRFKLTEQLRDLNKSEKYRETT